MGGRSSYSSKKQEPAPEPPKDKRIVERILLFLLMVIMALFFATIIWHQMFMPIMESEGSYVPETSIRPGPADRSERAP
jgi:hypothetical protein